MVKTREKIQAFLASALILCVLAVQGQEDDPEISIFPAGVHAALVFGKIAVKDKYISNEKYSGPIYSYTVSWSRIHEEYAYRLKFNYGFTDRITNNNASTGITLVLLSQGFLYSLKGKKITGHDLYVWMGPATDFVFFINQPNIAVDGFDYAQSSAAMLSLGINAKAVYPVSKKFSI